MRQKLIVAEAIFLMQKIPLFLSEVGEYAKDALARGEDRVVF